MTRRILPLAILLAALGGTPALAELSARTTIQFSKAELLIIERNSSLKAIYLTDPATVRRFLDDLEDADLASDEPGSGDDDPDVKKLERASPEAAHDLLQLIKKAGAGGKPAAN